MYSTGTLSLTNGSTSVTGTSTAWVSALRPGWLVLIPSEAPLLVQAVNSDSSLTLARPYQGTTRTGVVYNAVPTRGELAPFVTQLQSVLSSMQATIDGAGAGKFPDGSTALPGVRFSADEDSGLRRKGSNALALVTGGADRLEVNNAGAVLTGLLTGTAVTQSAVDTTAGRLLKVGDFGMGTVAIQTETNLDLYPPGFAVTPFMNTCSNVPPAVAASTGRAVMLTAGNNGALVQVMWFRADNRLFLRTATTTLVGAPWVEVIQQGRIVGSVSQAAGVPTGAVIERGSNANGEYVRFADGTQICTKRVTLLNQNINTPFGSMFSSASLLAGVTVYAASFIAPPVCQITAHVANLTVLTAVGGIGDTANTPATVFVVSPTSVTDRTIYVNVTANGRWF